MKGFIKKLTAIIIIFILIMQFYIIPTSYVYAANSYFCSIGFFTNEGGYTTAKNYITSQTGTNKEKFDKIYKYLTENSYLYKKHTQNGGNYPQGPTTLGVWYNPISGAMHQPNDGIDTDGGASSTGDVIYVGYCSNSAYVGSNFYLMYWIPKFTITLDQQEGINGTPVFYEVFGLRFTGNIQSVTPPTRANYTFGGYFTGKNGTGAQVIDSTGKILVGNTYFTSDTRVYAKWTSSTATVTCIDKVGNASGAELGRFSWQATTGTTASGTQRGTDTTPGAYYTGYQYTSATSATVTTSGATVYRIFNPVNYTVTCIDKVGNASGAELGRGTWQATIGTTVSGTQRGTDTTPGAYYTGYQYTSATSATVTTSGATVYRIFNPVNYTVTCIDKVGNTSGTELGRGTWQAPYGTTVSGTAKGTDTTSGKYYTGYRYATATSTTVTTNGATVYRIFSPITYTVTYHGNNPDTSHGINVTGTMEQGTFTYDRGAYTKTNTFKRNAYTFTGWNRTSNGTGEYHPNPVYVLNWANTQGANINLYAQWRLDTRNINGQVNWDDQNNKYTSRPQNVQVTLHHDNDTVPIKAFPTTNNPVAVVGNSTYSFNGVQDRKESNNTQYNYTVTQNVVPGYQTTINGYNITNKLITPTYESSIVYTPVNSYQNTALKNGKIKIKAQATANQTNQDKVGVHQGTITFTIDNDITIDDAKTTIKYYEAGTNITHKIEKPNYTINGNTITVKFGKDQNGISQKGDKITIETEGTLNQIKTYTSNISLTGKLYDYRGTTQQGLNPQTNINLGTVTQTTTNLTVQNQLPEANIQLTKKDSITGQKLTDATFTLYEWNGSQYIEKETITDDNQDGIYTSKYYRWNNTTNGKYKIVETGIPENHKNLNWSMEYNINQIKQENYTITPDYTNTQYTITYNKRNPDNFHNTNGTVENEPYKIKAKIDVLDEETKQRIEAPSIFTIYEWDKTTNTYKQYASYTNNQTPVEIIRQQDNTYITGEWLYYTNNNEGKYRIIQTTAPKGYYGDYNQTGQKRTYDINILQIVEQNEQNNETTINITNNNDITFTNKRTRAQINVTKVDSQTKAQAQMDASLQGAEYQIYAKENIQHADGTTTNYQEEKAILYKKDQLVQEQTTNEQGQLIFNNLECGKYYIKEKTASQGYLLDEKTYEMDLTYQNEEIETIIQEKTLEEKVKKQAFQIYKIQQNSRTEYEGLQNAGFTIYQISNLSIVKNGKITKNHDGTYTLNDENAKKDERITKQANKNGTYDIRDLVDYYYKIQYTEEDKDTLPQDQNVYHPYSIDQEEKVKNYENTQQGETIQEIRTNSNGYIKSPELAYGEYIVLETSVPKNLETAKPFVVKIQEDSREPQKLKFIIDQNFKAKVKLYKKDMETKQTVLQKDVKYVIYNQIGELITTKTWDSTNGYVEYGTLEHPYTTSQQGYLITPIELPVGTYTIKELEAPNGYTLNGHEGYAQNGQTIQQPKQQTTFEISTNAIYHVDDYLNQNIITITQENKQQVGSLKLTAQGEYIKQAIKDNNQNYNFIYQNDNIEGATFEIKAKQNITTQDGQGTIKYQKDQTVQTITTNEQGIAYADNLPLGEYYIKQTKAGEGFALNQEQKEFTLTYGSNNKELTIQSPEWKQQAQTTPVVNTEANYTNQRQNLEITIQKIDEETKENLEGAEFGLYCKNPIQSHFTNQEIIAKDTLIQKQTTNEQGQLIFANNLPLGEYYIKELKAPTGYIYDDQTIPVNGNYNQNQQPTTHINNTYTNQKTNINILKTDTEGTPLQGAILQIKDSKENVVQEWTTAEQSQNIKALNTEEQYKIVEKTPAPGYVTAQDIPFTINNQGEITTNAEKININTIQMKDQKTQAKIELKDIKTNELVEEATLKIVNQNNEEVAKWETANEAHLIEKLPIGNYTLKQEKAPTQKGYVTADDIPFQITDTKEIQTITMTQDITKVEISLEEKETEEKIEGVQLQIKNKETGVIIKEWETTSEPYYIERLPVGQYILQQKKSATESGYISMEDIEFQIQDTAELQKVAMKNDVTKLQITLKDGDNYVIGSKLQIVNKETNEVIREWTTGEEPYYTQKLPVGKYILQQTEIDKQAGYVTIEPVEFEIEDKKEETVLNLQQEVSKVEIDLVEKGTNTKIEGAKLQIKDSQGNIVEGPWETTNEAHYIEKLPVGKYILEEIQVSEEKGYVTSKPIEFIVEDKVKRQTITMEQDITKIEISVKDKDTGKNIIGSKLQIIDKQTGELVQEWISSEENCYIEKLPIGQYILKQIDIDKQEGNITTPQIEFTINNNSEVQTIIMEQAVTQIDISLIDKDDKTFVEGSKLQIVKIDNETKEEIIVEEWITGKDVHHIERLSIGEYKLKQLEALTNKGYTTTKEIQFKIEDKVEIQKVEMVQSVSKVEISIKGKDTEEEIEGAELEIKEKETGKTVAEWTSEKEPHYIEKLPVGKYILEETKAPTNKGYVKAEPIEIEIKDTEETQKIELVNDYTKLEISVVDKETKELVIGAKVQIKDKETGKTIDEWISDKEPYHINKLAVGSYILEQTEAPTLRGYVKAEPIEFEVQETDEVQKIQLEEECTKVTINIVDPETKKPVIGATVVVKTEDGKEIEKWTTTEKEHEISKLPEGKYQIEIVEAPYGYKTQKTTIQVEATDKIQEKNIDNERETFDIKVEKRISKIIRNGQVTQIKDNKLKKVEIKDKKVNTENIQIEYTIKVANEGKIEGTAGKIIEHIPNGLEFIASNNKGYWKEENGKIIADGIANKTLKPGEYAELQIVLQWKNGTTNFGTKINKVTIEGQTNELNYKEKDDNNEAKAEIIIGLSTGERNILYIAEAVLLSQILIAVVLLIKMYKMKM